MTLDPQACRDLAVAVMNSAITDLKTHHKPREIAFFLDAKKSELWCIAAGLDWDATVSRLRHDGHLVPAPVPLKRKDFTRNLR